MGAKWQLLGSMGGRTIRLAILVTLATCWRSLASAEASRSPFTGILPVLVFQTDGKAVQDRTRVTASLTVLAADERGVGYSIDKLASGPAEISARGNSSYFLQKQSFRLELQDESGRDRKKPLLGLPSDSDWVLYASATDRTFARNILAHELWRSMGRYAVEWRFAEVFIVTNRSQPMDPLLVGRALPGVLRDLVKMQSDSEASGNDEEHGRDDVSPDLTKLAQDAGAAANSVNEVHSTLVTAYRGIYVVFQKIKRGKARVDIAKLGPEDNQEPGISGGYIIKKDDQGREDRGVLTGQELQLRFEEPKERELSPAQRLWMTRYLDRFEKALYGKQFREPQDGYATFIDTESFIDFHWMVEISKNADGYWLSQYMHKDRGRNLAMGPLWDWDNTFGNPFFGMSRTNQWKFEAASDPDYAWYRRLFEDPDFLQGYVDRWSELRTNQFGDARVFAIIDKVADAVRSSVVRDENRWFRRGKVPVRIRAGITFDDEINLLKEWIGCRLAWIDNQSFPKARVALIETEGGSELTVQWSHGRCFFTRDGSDPRARGGSVSAAAQEYTVPVRIRGPTSAVFRIRSQFGLWSAPVVITPNSQSAKHGINAERANENSNKPDEPRKDHNDETESE